MSDEPDDTRARSEDAEPDDPVLEALWSRVLSAWDDDAPHAAALEHALREERLGDLAGRYRTLVDDPVRGPRAQRRLDAIVAAAMTVLESLKTPPPTRPPWQMTAVAALLAAFALTWLAWKILGGGR